MPSTTSMAGALLLAGVAAANPFTTWDVCPGADPTVAPLPITAQHQSISTCSPVTTTCSAVPTSTASWGGWESTSAATSWAKNATTTTPATTCSTSYSYSTWAWVSTVIPCGWNGKSISSCTVTSTQQVVPCEVSVTTSTTSTPTLTSTITDFFTFTVTPTATPTGYSSGQPWPTTTSISTSYSTITDYSTQYQTISKMWNAPYNKLGPNAIPGYDGNDLYQDDSTVAGSSDQYYEVIECSAWGTEKPVCSSYTENHYNSISGYHSTPVTATNSVKTSVPSAGPYTFTFTNSAPSAVITSGGQTYTQPPHPWFNYQTTTATAPGNFEFTVTVTTTISVYWPGSTKAGSPSPIAASHAWGNWNAPSTPTSGGDPSWGNWGQVAASSSAPAQTGAPWGGNGGFAGFPGAPGSGTFYIPVDTSSGSKYSTSGNQWIGFPNGGDDGAVVTGQGNAAQFYWDSEGNLMCNGQYVYTSTSAGYLVFELGPNVPSGPKFSVGSNGNFGLSGAGFCATDDTLFITYGSSPNGCKPVSCPLNGPSSASSTAAVSWGQWGAATSSATWATSSAAASTTWTGPSPTGSTFAIKIVLSGSKMARRDSSYVAFSGNSAVLTSDATNAALFVSGGGNIFLAGSTSELGASSASGASQLELFTIGSSGNSLASSFDVSSIVTYPGAGFCVTGGSVEIFFGDAPSGCLVATLGVDSNPSATTSSPTADPSGDLEATATPTPASRKRGGVLRF